MFFSLTTPKENKKQTETRNTYIQNKQNKNNDNKTKQIKMRQKAYKNTAVFLLCWPSTPRRRACPEVSLIYPERLHWRKLIFLFAGGCQLQIVSWLEVGESMFTSPPWYWDPVWLLHLCLRPQSPKFLCTPSPDWKTPFPHPSPLALQTITLDFRSFSSFSDGYFFNLNFVGSVGGSWG